MEGVKGGGGLVNINIVSMQAQKSYVSCET
nr:MAG TPA: hypothetical protein [Caudoviricetes sp.]